MENKTTGAPTLIYQGQASIRIVTAEGKGSILILTQAMITILQQT